jgi:hypothetical protein
LRFYLFFGFFLWLAATLVFRFWGEELIDPNRPLIWFSFILIVPGIFLIMNFLYRYRRTAAEDRPKAAIMVAIPGMLLDLFSIGLHSAVFPDLPAANLHLFFVWLLWAYSLIILGGLLGSKTKAAVSR